MNIVAFPVARRARQEAVKLARGHGYSAVTIAQLIRNAARHARTMLPVLAARHAVKGPDEPVVAA